MKTNHKYLKTILLGVSLMTAAQVFAQQSDLQPKDTTTRELRHTINMCPLGTVLGIFSVNYEYLIKPHHGLVFRADYEAIPKTYGSAGIDANGFAFVLNYRYHAQGKMESCFVGTFARFRQYQGKGKLENQDFDFTIPDITLGLNVGRRWVWSSGFNIAFNLGYGYMIDRRKVDNGTEAIYNAIDEFQDGYDFISGFLGELSIGYSF